MKRDSYSDFYKEHEIERSYMRNLPYDCANCGYIGRPSSSGIICGTCVLKKSNKQKINKNSGA
jgi:hypothetical protein